MLRGRPRFLPSACGLAKPILVSPNQARQIAERMIGSRLITKQTGPAGRICNAVSFSVKFEICFFSNTDNVGHASRAPYVYS